MSKVILGIDPDSDRHGVAIYIDGNLSQLKMLNTIELYRYIKDFHKKDDVTIHLEDVKRNTATWHACNKRVEVFGQASQRVGMNKQAQRSIEQLGEVMNIKVILHRPSSMWKKSQTGKKPFERITGWKGRSNEDSRSAAWFGYLGVTGRYS